MRVGWRDTGQTPAFQRDCLERHERGGAAWAGRGARTWHDNVGRFALAEREDGREGDDVGQVHDPADEGADQCRDETEDDKHTVDVERLTAHGRVKRPRAPGTADERVLDVEAPADGDFPRQNERDGQRPRHHVCRVEPQGHD